MKWLVSSVVVVCLLSGNAYAQATRTWVSGVGDDVNPCSRTAPCKTWAGAISKTAIGGEIDALDSGGFGTLTITKSITIDGNGVIASTLGSFTNGFTINIAPNANDPMRRVVIRNVTINGTGIVSSTIGTNTGLNAINVVTNGASSVTLENVNIMNFNKGVSVTTTANNTKLFMTNVSISNSTTNGISLSPTAPATMRAHLDNVRVSTTGTTTAHAGILVGGANTHLNNVTVFGSGGAGVHVTGAAAVTINDTTLIGNGGAGFLLDNGGALAAIGSSTAAQNGAGGWRVNAGVVLSYRDNQSANNGLADSANPQQVLW